MSYNHLTINNRNNIEVLNKVWYFSRRKGKSRKSKETRSRFNIGKSINKRPKEVKKGILLVTGN